MSTHILRLDKGAGKDISLDECPRSQLEKEKIKYLSAEQRLNYLVNIEFDGRLRWAKNNQLIDTTAGHWIDAGDDCGIVPRDPTCESSPEHSRARRRQTGSSPSLSNQATHYVGPRPRKYKWVRLLQRYMTPRGMMDRLLRKTVRRNTWIYVSDKNCSYYYESSITDGILTSSLKSIFL
ncbi:hypothetical protein FPV67DRAFT_73740 [Lyophyllum atratum]|nr:hypothetical protein FPV67DRAFT_73740 [Lyophyllum atratum]